MGNFIDRTGEKFGRLTIIGRADNIGRQVAWSCVCDCGSERVIQGINLTSGHTVSCGCFKRDFMTRYSAECITHGMTKHPLFKTWEGMIARCHNPKATSWDNYGARGIVVCDEWRDPITGPKAFFDYMGERPVGANIDRKDNNGNYEPGNVQWKTKKENLRNRRITVMIEAFGESRTLIEWAEELNMSEDTLRYRINKGYSPEDALTLPKHGGYKKKC